MQEQLSFEAKIDLTYMGGKKSDLASDGEDRGRVRGAADETIKRLELPRGVDLGGQAAQSTVTSRHTARKHVTMPATPKPTSPFAT